MSEHPILFSGPMVRAIMTCADCGTMSVLPACPKCGSTRRLKTMVRGVVKPQPYHLQVYEYKGKVLYDGEHRLWCQNGHMEEFVNDLTPFCPYGQPGDTLIVKETWQYNPYGGIVYRAGSGIVDWRPSTNMPRWASRLTLRLLDVRVERLQDITEEDARAEGCDGDCGIGYIPAYQAGPCQYQFAQLWDTINGKKYPWESNPWVWALAFEIVRAL